MWKEDTRMIPEHFRNKNLPRELNVIPHPLCSDPCDLRTPLSSVRARTGKYNNNNCNKFLKKFHDYWNLFEHFVWNKNYFKKDYITKLYVDTRFHSNFQVCVLYIWFTIEALSVSSSSDSYLSLLTFTILDFCSVFPHEDIV